ncbi:MAG TPA: cytochrome P450, partial [Vicinamibacterales bacterium]|nr:cytochrome P450 [Vicinamibacterales bacterium]
MPDALAATPYPRGTTAPPLMLSPRLDRETVRRVGFISAFFLEGYRTLGPIFRFRRGPQEFTVLAGRAANLFVTREGKRIIRADDYRRDQNLEFGVDQTLVSLSGEEHLRHRRIQKRGYSRTALDARSGALMAIVGAAAARWATGQRLHVRDVFPPIIAEQLGVGVLNYPLGDYFDDVTLFARTVVAETVAKTRPRSVIDTPEYERAKTRSLELADKVIAAHRDEPGGPGRPDLVDDLLDALAADPTLMTPQELRIAVLGGYIGGLDTVAYTCTFMLYCLLTHPETLARATAEVDRFFAADPADTTPVSALRTLHHTALETLRLYPLSGAIQATAAVPFEFSGYHVPAGADLIVATTVPHFLPEHFPDPFTFDIERYAPPRNEHHVEGAFAPFGIGPHLCLGAGMAETLIILTMAALLRTVRLELDPPDYELEIEMIPVPVPKNFRVVVSGQRHAVSGG